MPDLDHGTAVHALIDPILTKVGNLAEYGASRLDNIVQDHPAVGVALKLLDLGLTLAGGPARLALGQAMSRVSGKATEMLTQRFEEVGYRRDTAVAGGIGGPVTLTAITTGFGGTLKLAGVFGGIRSKIDRNAFRTTRESFWKNEASTNAGSYNQGDLARMLQGKAPRGSDGFPMELHHVDRTPDGPLVPMTRTDHRLGDNYKKNHPPE